MLMARHAQGLPRTWADQSLRILLRSCAKYSRSYALSVTAPASSLSCTLPLFVRPASEANCDEVLQLCRQCSTSLMLHFCHDMGRRDGYLLYCPITSGKAHIPYLQETLGHVWMQLQGHLSPALYPPRIGARIFPYAQLRQSVVVSVHAPKACKTVEGVLDTDLSCASKSARTSSA